MHALLLVSVGVRRVMTWLCTIGMRLAIVVVVTVLFPAACAGEWGPDLGGLFGIGEAALGSLVGLKFYFLLAFGPTVVLNVENLVLRMVRRVLYVVRL